MPFFWNIENTKLAKEWDKGKYKDVTTGDIILIGRIIQNKKMKGYNYGSFILEKEDIPYLEKWLLENAEDKEDKKEAKRLVEIAGMLIGAKFGRIHKIRIGD